MQVSEMIRQADVFLKKRVELDEEMERNTMALLDFMEENVEHHYYQATQRNGERTVYTYINEVFLGGMCEDAVEVKCVDITFQEIDKDEKDSFGLTIEESRVYAEELPIFNDKMYEVVEIDLRIFMRMLDEAYMTISQKHLSKEGGEGHGEE